MERRALISKVLTGSMVVGAALAVAACGPEPEPDLKPKKPKFPKPHLTRKPGKGF